MGMPEEIGIVDTMIAFPATDFSQYDFIRAQLKDGSTDMDFPVEYMFKNVPKELYGNKDPVSVTLHEMDRFGIDVSGRRAVDVGAGTGGFTDCLLQRGAASVVAVDVGRAQLHERLRSDPRVEVRERTDVRELDPGAMGAPFGVVVADLSFISLRTVMIDLLGLIDTESSMVLLVKPQFEAGRAAADRGRGVIRDPEVRRRALQEVHQSVCSHGAAIMEGMESPISGAKGNLEYLVHVVLGGTHPGFDPAALVTGSPGAGRVGAP